MAVYNGRLFVGTLPEGRVHSIEAGRNATVDRPLPAGWRHLAAVRRGGRLEVFIDGLKAAESAAFAPGDYDLDAGRPLRIGAGENDYFHGPDGSSENLRSCTGPGRNPAGSEMKVHQSKMNESDMSAGGVGRGIGAAAWAVLAFAAGIFAAGDESRSLYIEGYAGQLSHQPGEEVAFHISTSAPKFTVEIARLGDQREIVWTGKDLPGREYPVPENASAKGCGWPESFKVPIPAEWRSGYYQVTLRVADSGGRFTQRNRRTAESDLYFVVRSAHPGRDTNILIQLTTNTYNAYNNWGGLSLYAYHGRAEMQGSRVSFHRPGGSQFASWELPFVAWAERNGYRLDYAVNSDLEFRPELLNHYKLVLSVGHDEYWSTPMRDHLEAFIGRGGNVAFFSGNTVLAGAQRRGGTRAGVLEAELPAGPGLPHRGPFDPLDALGPSSAEPAGEHADRRRLALGRLSQEPRPVHE